MSKRITYENEVMVFAGKKKLKGQDNPYMVRFASKWCVKSAPFIAIVSCLVLAEILILGNLFGNLAAVGAYIVAQVVCTLVTALIASCLVGAFGGLWTERWLFGMAVIPTVFFMGMFHAVVNPISIEQYFIGFIVSICLGAIGNLTLQLAVLPLILNVKFTMKIESLFPVFSVGSLLRHEAWVEKPQADDAVEYKDLYRAALLDMRENGASYGAALDSQGRIPYGYIKRIAERSESWSNPHILKSNEMAMVA